MTAEVVDRQERRKRHTRRAIQRATSELFAERGSRKNVVRLVQVGLEGSDRLVG
jgi:hypothetical protein